MASVMTSIPVPGAVAVRTNRTIGSVKNKINAVPSCSCQLRLFGGSNALHVLGCLGFDPPRRHILSASKTKYHNLIEGEERMKTDTSGMLGDIKSVVGATASSTKRSSLKEEDSRKLFPNCNMSQTTFSSSTNPTNMFGSNYCTQYPVDLTMVRDITPRFDSDYVVSHYANKIIKFCAPRDYNSLDEEFNVFDGDGTNKELSTLRKETLKWRVYEGHSTNDKNLLFSVKSCSTKHSSKVDLDVFLPYNIIEEIGDFKIIECSISEKTWNVYMGDNKIIAQIQKKHLGENIWSRKEKLMLYVHPYVDHAFIVALSVILNEMDCLQDPNTAPSILAFQRLIKFMVRLSNMPIFAALFLCFVLVKLARIIF